MRLAFALLLAFVFTPALAQIDVWKHVDPNYNGPRLTSATLPIAQQRAIARLVLASHPEELEPVSATTVRSMVKCMMLSTLPVTPKAKVILVDLSGACTSRGTGGGGGMWLVRMEAGQPVLLASPDDKFSGWLYSLQPSRSNGYRDIVLGWHLRAGESALTYFRFNGTRYESVSRAENVYDEKGGPRIETRIPKTP
jgi:hypothetical protein